MKILVLNLVSPPSKYAEANINGSLYAAAWLLYEQEIDCLPPVYLNEYAQLYFTCYANSFY